MGIRLPFLAAICVVPLLGGAPAASAQGKFSNFETPQTHPIEIASVGSVDYLLVCNTPDNSVEIYRAAPPHAFVQRVPVGLGPATVRWNAAHGRFYTCNFDGDSVSVVRLVPLAGGGIRAVIERTTSLTIGDSPSDIAFHPQNGVARVSLGSRSAVAQINVPALTSAGPELRLVAIDPLTALPFAVKMPRSIAWLADGRFFAANLRGGSPDPMALAQYDLGLYREHPASGPPAFVGGLGSTNHAFAVTGNGRVMFLVGTKAQNHAAVGVQAVNALKTGFVQSWLMVADVVAGAPMSVRPEAPAGTLPAPLLQSINLNRNYGSIPLTEVATDDALVQPTDVLVIERDGALMVVLTAFHSDRVAFLKPSATTPGGYVIQRVNIPVLNPGGSYSTVGPRGLAFSARNNLVFTNGRLDNTVAVLHGGSGALLSQFALQNDPTPVVIREGRQFLYSNRFSIDDSVPTAKTGGFESCAVCHVDGRTDGLAWDLGDTNVGPGIPNWFHDGNGQDTTTMPNFPDQKADMVTQTLQGLVNYELNEAFQFVATNAPYHWRGDKFDFVDFNEAFVNLQGMDNVSTPSDPKGISDADMVKYRRFVNTILHPSNPEQHEERITTGSLDATNPNDPTLATGALLGNLIYHDFPMVGLRSCVDCHSLPDGSTNTSTLTFLLSKTITGGSPPSQLHPLESAAVRNIAQREMVLHNDFTNAMTEFTANSGLLHPGDVNFLGFLNTASINNFIHGVFVMPGPGPSIAQQQQALTEFVRTFDTGTAPMTGRGYTVDPSLSPLDSGANKTQFDLLEGQVKEGNCGLGVYTRNNSTVKGYWYDISVVPNPMYREEGTSNLVNRAALLALAVGTDNVVIAQGTPLGGDRRWASAAGTATLISDLANPPANITLQPMAPDTAWIDVSKFNLNLNLAATSGTSIWTQRTLQAAVLGLGFGVPAIRHEPPRRFRVSGENIRAGARLLFAMPSGTTPASFPVEIMEMELYPTHHVTDDGEQLWETNVELDATMTFALLNGGFWAPDVANVLLRLVTAPALQPAAWNSFLVAVLNEDGSIGFNLSNWQVLKIQDQR